MMLRFFDSLVHWTAGVPVASFLVLIALGLASDAAEALSPRSRNRRTRALLLS